MSLSDLASVGSFVSALAVVASLIYLSLQVQQNSKHTRALIQQGRASGIAAEQIALANTDLVSAYIVGNGGVATPDEITRRQYVLQHFALLVRWTDTFSQHEMGLIGDDVFVLARRYMAGLAQEPGFRRFIFEYIGASASSAPASAFLDDLRKMLAETAEATTP